MHLSPLSDGPLSHRKEPHDIFHHMPPSVGQAHRDGLLRGLALLGVFAVLIVIALMCSAPQPADAASIASSDAVIHHALNPK